jgi:fibronectin-binding autotransporter adhesin
MANRYWVGGTGTWNTSSTTNWSASSGGASGSSVPTAADSVFFDQAGTYTVTMTGALLCLDITVSAGTVTFATGTTPTLAVTGSMSLVAGTVWNSTGAITFNATTTGKTITTNGTTLNGAVTFIFSTGGWSLGSALTVGATLTTTLTGGALALNGFDLTTGLFATGGALARSIAFGSNNIVLNAASGTVLSAAVLGGFTCTGTGGFTADASVVRTYTVGSTSGGATTNAPNLSFTGSGTAIPVLTTASWFNTLSFGTTAFTIATTNLNLNGLTLSTTGTFTLLTASMRGTGNINCNGNTTLGPLTINTTNQTTATAAVRCTTFTRTAGNIDFANFSLTCTNALTGFTNTFAPLGTINLNNITCTTYTVNGTVTLAVGQSLTTTTSIVTATAFTINGTLTTPLFTHTSGTVTLGAAVTLAATGTYTLTAGTLDLAGFTLTTGIFSSSGSGVRSIAFSTGTIVLAHTTPATTVLLMSVATNFTYTGTGGFASAMSVTRTFDFGSGGGSSTNAPNLSITSGSSVPTFVGSSWFNALNFTGSTCAPIIDSTLVGIQVSTLTLDTGGTYTGFVPTFTRTQTWTSQFSKQLGGIGVNGTGITLTLDGTQTFTATSVLFITAGTLNLGGFDLTIGRFTGTSSIARSISFGTNNIILAHTSPGTGVLNVLSATNFTYTGTGGFVTDASITRTLTFGPTGATATNSPNVTLTGSGTAVLTFATGSYFNKLNFGTTAFNPGTTALNLNSLTLSSGGTFTNLTATMVGTGTITLNGNTTLGQLEINNSAVSGTFTLPSALQCVTFVSTSGTIDFATFNLTCSSTATYTAGTLNNIGTINCTTWTVQGTFTLTQGTITPSVSFVLTSGAFNYNGGTLSAVPTFSHTAGTVTLGQPYALTATGTYTLTAGTLALAGFTLTTGIFSSSGSGVRSIAFGTGNIVLAHTTAATTVLSMATATNFTYTGTGGFTTDASITRTVNFAGSSTVNPTIAPNLTLTGSGTSIITFAGNSEYGKLDFGTTAFTVPSVNLYLNSLTLSSGGTFTGLTAQMVGTGTITPNTNTTLGGLYIGSNSGTSGTTTLAAALTLTATSITTLISGTLDLSGFTLTTGIFASSGTVARSIAFGTNNIVLAHTTAATTVLSFVTATGFTYTGTGGFTTDASITRTVVFGTTGGSSTNAPNLAITSGSSTITFTDGSWFNALNFTGSTTTPALSATLLGVNVSTLTLATGGTYTGFIPVFTRTQTWTSQFSKQLGGIGVNGTGVTLTLDNTQTYTTTSTTILTSGTLDLGGYDLQTGIFSSSNSNTRSISFGTNNIVLTHTTATTTVLSMTTATGFTYTGTGGFTADASVARTYDFGSTAGGTATNGPNLSFTGSGTSVATLTGFSFFNKLDYGTTAFNSGLTSLFLKSLTLSTTGTYNNFSANMVGTGGTIIGNGKTISALTLDSTLTGTVTLGSALTVNGQTNHANGSLVLNNFTLTTGTYVSAVTNARSISFGTANIVLVTATPGTVLNMADISSFTWTGTGGFTSDASITRTYTCGSNLGFSANAPNLTLTGSGTAVQTFTTNSVFNTINFGTTAFTVPTTTVNVNYLTLNSGCTFTGMTVSMIGTGSITSNSKTIAGLTINTSGTASLGDQLTFALATATTTLTSGTFNLNGFTLTTGIFSSTGSGTRSISFGTNNIVLAHTTAATTVLSMATATGFTYTGTGGFTTDASITRTLTFGTTGGSVTNAPNLTLTGSGTAVLTLNTNSWFNNLNFGTTAFVLGTTSLSINGNLTLSSGGTFTGLTAVMVGTSTITTNTKTIAALTINSGTTTLADALSLALNTASTTLTSGTLNLAGFTLTTGIFSSNNSNTRSISFGIGNIVLIHPTATTTVLSMATATGFTYTGTGGFTTDATVARAIFFGSAAGGTSSNAPNVTITGTGTSVISFATNSYFNKLDFGTTAYNPGTTALNLNSLTLSSGGTFTTLTATMVGTGTITPSTNTTLGALTVNSTSGTTTLAAALTLTATGTTTLTSGTLALNGFNLTTGIFSSTGAVTRSISFGSNNIVLAHTTAGTTVLSMATATGFTYTGTGGFTTDASITRTLVFGTTGGTATNAPNLTLTGSGTAVLTFTTASWFSNLNFGTTAFILGTTALSINGNLTLSSGGTFTGLTPTMVGTGTITTNNKTIAALTINSTSGTTTLGDQLAFALATATTTLTSGTLNLNGFNLTTGIFSSTGAVTRSISFGTNNIVLAHTTAATTVLNMATATGFTYTGTGGFTTAMTVTRTFTFGTTGGSSTNSPNLFITSGASNATLTTGSYFNKLDCTGTYSGTIIPNTPSINLNSLTLNSNGDYSGLNVVMISTGTITMNGSTTGLRLLTINAPAGTVTLGDNCVTGNGTGPNGVATTLTAGTLNLNNFNLTTYIFSSNNTNTRSISFGSGNITLIYNSSSNITILDMANATNFTCSGSGAFYKASSDFSVTYTFGTTGGSYSNSPNLTFGSDTSTSVTLTTGSYFNKINFGTATATPTAATLNLNAFTLSSGGTYTNLTINMVGTGVITTNGRSLPTLTINNGAASGTTTLGGAVTTTTSTTLTSGTLALAGYTLTPTQFISGTAATRAISGAGTGVISLSNDWTVSDGTGFTGSDYTINMTKATAKTFAGAGGSYGILVQAGAGALTISGSNTLADIQATTRPSTISFTAGTTQTVSLFTLAGTSGNLVTINSVTSGSQFTLSKASGTVTASYLSIKDSNATGGAVWDASNGTNTNVSNNTGWIFTAPTNTGNGNFMAFF